MSKMVLDGGWSGMNLLLVFHMAIYKLLTNFRGCFECGWQDSGFWQCELVCCGICCGWGQGDKDTGCWLADYYGLVFGFIPCEDITILSSQVKSQGLTIQFCFTEIYANEAIFDPYYLGEFTNFCSHWIVEIKFHIQYII